jgi:DNA-binding NarL/FixJ family response regulator
MKGELFCTAADGTAAEPDGEAPAPRPHAARIRLLLIDDHAMLREGLRALLEMEPDLEVAGEAGSVDEAMALIAMHRPDVVLTDIGLPGRSGLELLRELRTHSPLTRVVLLTAHTSEEYIRAGLDAHADGYVSKDSSHAELVTAVRSVADGRKYLCKAVASRVVAGYLNRDAIRTRRAQPGDITAREREVLTRIAAGMSNKGVARELALSVKTVEKHRANLMRKLGLHNAAGITRYALRHEMSGGEGGIASGLGVAPAVT